jgi:hypothetical protein
MGADAPEIEELVSARLRREKYGNEEADKNERQGRRGVGAERRCQGDPRRGDRPIGGGVKTRARDCAAV